MKLLPHVPLPHRALHLNLVFPVQQMLCLYEGHCALQVFVPSDAIGDRPIVGAGICIASTDLLFTERTVEQASSFPLHLSCWASLLFSCSVLTTCLAGSAGFMHMHSNGM